MIEVVWDEGFKRAYKKKIRHSPHLKNKFSNAVELFEQNPFHSRLRTHKLTGKLEGLWAFSVDRDCRVVFVFLDSRSVMFVDMGGHDDVY